jgi:hypothetical protein
MCPVYLSSRGGGLLLLLVDEEECLEELIGKEDVGSPKRVKYEWEDLAGRFKARAALCNIGHVVDEKLYGTELWSIGCTCEVRILMFSSTN